MTSTELVRLTPLEQFEKNCERFQYKPGHRSHKRGPGTTPLNDPEFVEWFARAVAEGLTVEQIAEIFDIGKTAVYTYKKDMRVRAAAIKYIEDRVIRITRKVDAQIEQRLQEPDALDTETLLKIRKEFLGGVMRQQTQGSKEDDKTIYEGMEQIENNPEFADDLRQLLERHQEKATNAS